MYRTILVPLDGSPYSEFVLPVVGALAQTLDAQVVLMRAVGEAPVSPESVSEEEARKYLARVARLLTGRGVNVEIAVPYLGPCEAILQESLIHHADLIAMCTHGRSRLGQWVHGSVAEDVLTQSPIPILFVRPRDAAVEPGPLKASSLLVPLDGSAFAEAALPHATAFAQALHSSLVLLRVIPAELYSTEMTFEPYATQELLEVERVEAEKYLAEVSGRLAHLGLTVSGRVHLGWSVDSIMEECETSDAGMIVMAMHGGSDVNDLILGDAARGILERGSRPLLLVRSETASN